VLPLHRTHPGGFEAPVHKRNYDAVTSAPTRYILFTQGHVDHVGGVRWN
jgi:glyoxylase-like metal-dependent hydrolase (beta-lactamase superfamily II)